LTLIFHGSIGAYREDGTDRRLPANVITMKKDPTAYWLYRQSASTFAIIWGGATFLALLIALIALQWILKHHINWAYILGYAVTFTIASTFGAMIQRRRRLQQGRSANKQDAAGDVEANS
jgi:hypothetical protein